MTVYTTRQIGSIRMTYKTLWLWGAVILAISSIVVSTSAEEEAAQPAKDAKPSSSCITWGTEKGGVQCALELVTLKSTLPAAEPVWIRCHTRKTSADETRLMWRGLLTYQLTVTDAEGKAVPQTRYGTLQPFARPYLQSGTRTHKWDEGREQAVKIHLNRLYDLSCPGRYTISFSRNIVLNDGTATEVESNSLVVEITETDVFVGDSAK